MKMASCDRCCKAFDDDAGKSRAIVFLNLDMPGNADGLRPVLLCPHCQDSAVKWFRALVDRALVDRLTDSLRSPMSPIPPTQERNQEEQGRDKGGNEQER